MNKYKINVSDNKYYVVYSESRENAVKKLRDAYINKNSKITDYQPKEVSHSRLEAIPLQARQELQNSKNKEATLLSIEGNIEDIINAAEPSNREALKQMGSKITNDLRRQFRITDNVDRNKIEQVIKSRQFELRRDGEKIQEYIYKGNSEDKKNAFEELAKVLPANVGLGLSGDVLSVSFRDNTIKDDNISEFKKELAKWQDLYINKKLITSSELSEKAKELRQKYNIKDEKLTSESILEKAKSLGGQVKQNGATGVLGISITSPQRSDEFADWLEKNNIHYNSDGRQYYVEIQDSDIKDSYYTESEKKNKQFVKNAIEEMEGYINNWNFLTAKQKRDIGLSREQLKARVAELRQVKDSAIKDSDGLDSLRKLIQQEKPKTEKELRQVYNEWSAKEHHGAKYEDEFRKMCEEFEIKDSAVNDSERYLIRKNSGAGEVVYETNDLQDAIEELRALGKSYYIDDTQKDITIKYSQAIRDSERRVYTFTYKTKDGFTERFECYAEDGEDARNQLQDWAVMHNEEPIKVIKTDMVYDSAIRDANKDVSDIISYFNAWGYPSRSELQQVVNYYHMSKEDVKKVFGSTSKYSKADLDNLRCYDSAIKDSNTVKDSIMQEYEEFKSRLGKEKAKSLDKFLNTHNNISYSDILYKKAEYDKFENWYSKGMKDNAINYNKYKIVNYNNKWFYETKWGDGHTSLTGPYTSREEAEAYFHKHLPTEKLDSAIKDDLSKVENIGKFTLWQDEDTKEYYFDATISRSGKKLHPLGTKDINKAREKVKKELEWITDSNIVRDGYDYIGNAMVFKSLPKIGEKAQKYGFGYSNSVISKIEKTYNKDGYQFYRVYCMDEEDYKNNHGTQYYYSVAIKDSNIVRDYSIEDAEELPHITKEQWNKIPNDYKTIDPSTGKKQAFAGSLGIAPGGTTLLTEGKHFIIDAENKEKNWTYVMFGTTGEKKVENLTKAEAEHLLKNNKLLGYSGKIYETVRDNDTNNTNKILDSDIVVARSLDELISKIKSWDGETTTNYILSPKSSGWYFDYFITMGHKYSYYAYIKKTAHGRHDNPNVDISKQNIDKTVTAKTAQELIDQVVIILK